MSTPSRSPHRLGQSARVMLTVSVSATLMLGSARVGGDARGAERGTAAWPASTDFAPLAPAAPTQVVVYDRVARTTVLVSHDPGSTEGNASSSRPSISADGSRVAFESAAGLAPEDTNRKRDVYLWERAGDGLQRISLARDGSPANGDSHDPSISGDGGVIAFTSTATNMTRGRGLDDRTSQVFAWQLATGGVVVASPGANGPGSAASSNPAVSRDGRVVAFESDADDLVTGDTNNARDVFLRDLARSATIRASVRSNGRQIGAASRRASVSGDGGAVAFDSTGTTVVPQDTNGVRDVFVRDLPPAVQITPTPLDFGVVPLGTPASRNVTVVSVGWTPVAMTASAISGANAGDFVIAGDFCAGQLMGYGTTCTVMVLHVPVAAGPRTASLSISDSARGSPQLVALVGGVPAPQVRLEPPLGPPGIVTVLSGSNFPPGAAITISWDRGITQHLDPIVVNPDGTFSVGVLIFHHDRLGPRQLAISPGPGGPTFEKNSAPFLVVPGPNQPTGSSALTFLSSEFQLVIRR